jgi:hypothetical protein
MIMALAILQLLAADTAVPGQRDSICREKCVILAVQDGTVRYIDQWTGRTLALGKYARSAQRLVPRIEAPVSDLRTPRGWRVIASAYFNHEDDELLMRLRFFGPAGSLRATGDALWSLEQASIGNLFGGPDEIFAITSNEEHSYNVRMEIWFLPEGGVPKSLFEIEGVYQKFAKRSARQAPGVTINRQTYDGVSAETKGWVAEFWKWDPQKKSLTQSEK